jgi:ABC-2 type transport system permease protein
MNIQTKACFKKELLAFTRTKKFFTLLCVFVGLAIIDPLIIRGTGMLMETLNEFEGMSELFGELTSYAANGVSSLINDISLAGLIVFLLLINSFAGGEQKRRSIIIPQSAGLGSHAYITPKFFVYPGAAFILCMLAVLVAAAVSASVFTVNDLIMSRVIIAGVLLGVHFMMYTCFHLCIGTATGKAGMSAAICIGASIMVPGFFTLLSMGIDGDLIAYNPFGLAAMAINSSFLLPQTSEIVATVLIAFALMVICWLLALFAQNAKKIDNRGNEMVI